MIVRTLRSLIPKQSLAPLCSSSIKMNTVNIPKFFSQNFFAANIRSYNFSTSNPQQNEEIESLLGELESENLENFEEPFIPEGDMNELTNLRRSLNQNINLGNYGPAHEDAYKYVQLIRKYYGTSHPALYSALNNLALIYKMVGEYQNAKVLYTKIMEGYLKIFGSKHLSTVIVMQNLANLLRETQEFEAAITIYEDVLAIRREIQPEKKIDQAVCLSSMAGAYRERKNYEKSEQYLQEALEIFTSELGEDHLSTATCLNNLALTYKKQKKFTKAEPLYLRYLF